MPLEKKAPLVFRDTESLADFLMQKMGSTIRVATPLGLGKPNLLLNCLFQKFTAAPDRKLSVYTALSLATPAVQGDLAKRFFAPFLKRQWGENYPNLEYFSAAKKDQLPENINVHEFYFQAGSALNSLHLQRNYQSVNYTHVAENLFRHDVHLIVQLIAKKDSETGPRYSLSCNPDVTLDVADIYKENNKPLFIVGVVHPDLPFLDGEAEVEASFFDVIQDSGTTDHQLFALPRMPMSVEDHLIGFYASLLVKDGGTLQIGIGSLSDAIVSALTLRQKDNAFYLEILKELGQLFQIKEGPAIKFETSKFSVGLYGLTEMLTDGFMHLRRAGILKRNVVDEDSGLKTYVHGSFILGSKDFYKWLRELPPEDRQGLRMTRVSKVNDLYDPKETLLRQQRVHGRFFNTTMQLSLLGEAASETLSDGSVISGVGGQYNFVSMALELKNAKSVLMLRSVRLEKNGRRVSNMVWDPGHFTISRHLRDIVITEYGVAFLKGKSDEECIQALLNITDSEFQQSLLLQAKNCRKISPNYQIPQEFTHNTPAKIQGLIKTTRYKEQFKPFPFGSDFTPEEENIVQALQNLQEDQKISAVKLLMTAFKPVPPEAKQFAKEIERMGFTKTHSLKDKFFKRLLLQYLSRNLLS